MRRCGAMGRETRTRLNGMTAATQKCQIMFASPWAGFGVCTNAKNQLMLAAHGTHAHSHTHSAHYLCEKTLLKQLNSAALTIHTENTAGESPKP